jgi:hypothetical protein
MAKPGSGGRHNVDIGKVSQAPDNNTNKNIQTIHKQEKTNNKDTNNTNTSA